HGCDRAELADLVGPLAVLVGRLDDDVIVGGGGERGERGGPARGRRVVGGDGRHAGEARHVVVDDRLGGRDPHPVAGGHLGGHLEAEVRGGGVGGEPRLGDALEGTAARAGGALEDRAAGQVEERVD